MARIEPLDLSEARAAMVEERSLTSENFMYAQSGNGTGWGGFTSAKLGRLTEDWPSVSRSMDQDLMIDLRRLRARARNQSINSPWAAKFLQLVRSNVAGEHGVKLVFKVPHSSSTSDNPLLDDKANQELTRAWREWGKRGSCTVCGRYSWRELQRLICENVARDGEQFLRKVYVPKSVNPFGFQLQLIDADQVDDNYNQLGAPNRNQIRMGIEVDANQKPLAYYLFDGNPYESYSVGNRIRVPASQIIHFFISHRTGQTRGYPWFAPAMSQLNMLDGYFFAELTAARISSSVVMSIESDPNSPAEAFTGDGLNADGSKAVDIGYGKAIEMPTGQHLANHTPQHPASAFADFVKQSGRGIASGMNVSYHKLCNDLSGVNMSSGRLGELEERDFWREIQTELIDDCLEPIYEAWLSSGLLTGAIGLSVADKSRFLGQSLKWEPRRWPWVDPLKDVQASTLMVQNGFETNESILNSHGRDLAEVYHQRKREQDMADELGLQFGTDIRGRGNSEVNAGPDTVAEDPEEPNNQPENAQEKPVATSAPAKINKPPKPTARPKQAPATSTPKSS